VDRTIKLWDARRGKEAVATVQIHNADVNVLAWNQKRAFFLASGSDDGTLNVLDLRTLR
jgi:WD40 repeat protein